MALTPKQLSEQLNAAHVAALENAKTALTALREAVTDLEEVGIPSEPGSFISRVRSTAQVWHDEANGLINRLQPPTPEAPVVP